MKRVLLAVCLSLGFAVSGVSALAIGGAFGIGMLGSLPNQALFSIKLNNSAPVIGVGVSLGKGSARLGATADWWLYHRALTTSLYTYLGLGGYLDVQTGSPAQVGVGVRLPIGLQLFVIKPLALFVEVAPRAGLAFNPIKFPAWGMQGAFGFRFWFR